MSEESGTPTESAAPETPHVSIGENGAFVFSQEALDAMDNVQPFEDPPEAPEEAIPAAAAAAVPPTRTIKHNGQAVEVPADREIEFLQKGYDYEHRMQGLEQERAKLQSYNGLVSAIESSPAIRAKVSEALGYTQTPAAPQTPQFDDPIEQLKWETRQEVMKEVEERFMKPMQAQNEQSAHQNQLNSIRQQVQTDPQFNDIQAAILEQIKALPESVGKNLYQQLDQDPRAYVDMFNNMKARLKPTAAAPQPQAVTPPTPTKRETKAPLLESGLNAAAPAAQQAFGSIRAPRQGAPDVVDLGLRVGQALAAAGEFFRQ